MSFELITVPLMVVFGLSSWITMNGLYTQLPLLIREHGYKVILRFVLAFSSANLWVLAYKGIVFFIQKVFADQKKKMKHLNRLEKIVIGGGILFSIGTMFGYGLMWKSGEAVLYMWVHLVGILDCLSSVTYWSFASEFSSIHIGALSTGESLTGTVAGVLAAIQNPGGDARFSSFVYCMVLIGVLVGSLISFLVLLMVSKGKIEEKVENKNVFPWEWTLRLCLFQFFISAMESGIVLVSQPYMFKHYENSLVLIQWGIILRMSLNPIVIASAYFIPFYNPIINVAAWIILLSGQLTISVLPASARPFRHDELFGLFLLLISIILKLSFGYSKAKEWILIHQRTSKLQSGYSSFRWAGLSIQLGSICGSVLMITLQILVYDHI